MSDDSTAKDGGGSERYLLRVVTAGILLTATLHLAAALLMIPFESSIAVSATPVVILWLIPAAILTGSNLSIIISRRRALPFRIVLLWVLAHALLWPIYAPYFAYRRLRGHLDIQQIRGENGSRPSMPHHQPAWRIQRACLRGTVGVTALLWIVFLVALLAVVRNAGEGQCTVSWLWSKSSLRYYSSGPRGHPQLIYVHPVEPIPPNSVVESYDATYGYPYAVLSVEKIGNAFPLALVVTLDLRLLAGNAACAAVPAILLAALWWISQGALQAIESSPREQPSAHE